MTTTTLTTFETPAKRASREYNIAALAGSDFLIRRDRLTRDWLELAADGAPTYNLLAARLGPARFIGVDKAPRVVKALQAENRPNAMFQAGLLHDVIALQPRLVSNVGVLNFDSTRGWLGDKIVDEVHALIPFVLQQYERCGEFLFIVNAAENRVSAKEAEATRLRAFAPLLAAMGRDFLREDEVYRYNMLGRQTSKTAAQGMVNVRLCIGFRPESSEIAA